MIASNIWEEILSRVQAKVNRHSFYTWFKPTSFVADDGSTVTVRVPNALFKDWITKHYSGVIAEALDEVRRTDALVNFVASGTPEAEARVQHRRRRAPEPNAEPGPESNPELGTGTWNQRAQRRGPASSGHADVLGRPEPSLHLRHVHRRIVESVRPCGVPRGGRSAVALVQPAVHLRRRRARARRT